MSRYVVPESVQVLLLVLAFCCNLYGSNKYKAFEPWQVASGINDVLLTPLERTTYRTPSLTQIMKRYIRRIFNFSLTGDAETDEGKFLYLIP